jgi:hypothetical protein
MNRAGRVESPEPKKSKSRREIHGPNSCLSDRDAQGEDLATET